jgi:hypothetical protein
MTVAAQKTTFVDKMKVIVTWITNAKKDLSVEPTIAHGVVEMIAARRVQVSQTLLS